MTEPTELTFRDFAGAIMGSDTARAAEVLAQLLGLEADVALAATTHFQRTMTADPNFMMKAMGLRAAVTSGTDEQIGSLLGECFGLSPTALPAAIATLRKKYPAPA